MNTKIKIYSGWVVAAFFCTVSVKLHYEKIQLIKDCAVSRSIVTVALPKLKQAIDDIHKDKDKSDSTYSSNKYPGEFLPPQPELTGKLDTVQRALTKTVNDQVSIETKALRDSLTFFKGQLLAVNTDLTKEKKSRLNLIVNTDNPRSPVYAQKAKDASIGLYEFQRKKYPSIFSPMRNYLKVTNNLDSGTVNGMPFLDYELRNDDIYQVMFQMRTAYSPTSNRKTIGLGAELKLNKVSVNAVMNYDGQSRRRWLNPSFGLRYDFARIVLK